MPILPILVADPDTAVDRVAHGSHPPFGGDDDFFQKMDEVFDTHFGRLQVEDQVGHQLARTVIGDVAAPFGLDDLDAGVCEEVGRNDQVFPAAAAAQGENRRVFEQYKKIGSQSTGLARRDEAMLKSQGLAIVEQPGSKTRQVAGRSACIRCSM